MMSDALRAPSVIAMLVFGHTTAEARTVTQYIVDTANPDLKAATEMYAMGVGHRYEAKR
jgi:hypothetical protein